MALKNENREKLNFALGPENYKLLGIGFAIIVAGFLLMLGGNRKIRMSSATKYSVSEELHLLPL